MWYKQRLMAQVNGKELFGQLVKELSSDDRTGTEYGEALRKPDSDRSLLLTAHIVVERLIESMLETRLPHREFWIPTADFDSKVRLARALGLIREQEHHACSVLNKARNALAHKLEPLPEKWRVELKRVASVIKPAPDDDPDSYYVILRRVVAVVLGCRNKRVFEYRRTRLRHDHGQRWLEIMKHKIDEEMMSDEKFDEELINIQVDLQLVREVNERKSKEQK
jgi:hypothetical protein